MPQREVIPSADERGVLVEQGEAGTRIEAASLRQQVAFEHEAGIGAQMQGVTQRRVGAFVVAGRGDPRQRKVPPHDRVGRTRICGGLQCCDRVGVSPGVEEPHAEQSRGGRVRAVSAYGCAERVVLL